MYESWWHYHITSHYTTWENPLATVGEADMMMPIMINTPIWGRHTLNEGNSSIGLDNNASTQRKSIDKKCGGFQGKRWDDLGWRRFLSIQSEDK